MQNYVERNQAFVPNYGRAVATGKYRFGGFVERRVGHQSSGMGPFKVILLRIDIVSIIVSERRTIHLVATSDHRDTGRDHQKSQSGASSLPLGGRIAALIP